ncbi:MAG: hypothetical protein AB7O62_20790, partial [Pirellulales bacterium]
MPDETQDNLLAKLAGRTPGEAAKTWADIAARQPQHVPQPIRVTPPPAEPQGKGPAVARPGQFTVPVPSATAPRPPQPAAAPLASATPAAQAGAAPASANSTPESRLEQLMKRIGNLTSTDNAVPASSPARPAPAPLVSEPQPGNATSVLARPPEEPIHLGFLPVEPQTFSEAKVTASQVEAIVLRYMLVKGSQSGRDIAEQVKLSFKMIDDLLRQMKTDQLVVYSGTAPMSDYYYQLTDTGRERGRRFTEECSYFGS